MPSDQLDGPAFSYSAPEDQASRCRHAVQQDEACLSRTGVLGRGRVRVFSRRGRVHTAVKQKKKKKLQKTPEGVPFNSSTQSWAWLSCLPMLSERFIVSTRWTEKASPPPAASLKDVGICIQELQPTPGLRGAFKKSSTAANCLAVSASHVFAAQADKAVLHVYSREKGSQEAVVPFPERIRSIALAPAPNGDGDILVLGTEGGRLIVWEVLFFYFFIFFGLLNKSS